MGDSTAMLARMAALQSLLVDGFMREEELKRKISQVTGSTDDGVYSAVVDKVNEQVKFAQFRIKTILSPVDNIRYVGFINLDADNPSKMASHYSISQREFYKQAIELIATSPRTFGTPGAPCVSESDLLNMELAPPPPFSDTQSQPPSRARTPTQKKNPQAAASVSTQQAAAPKLTMMERTGALKLLVQEGWLSTVQGQEGFYGLGVRAFMELSLLLLSLDLPDSTREAWTRIL